MLLHEKKLFFSFLDILFKKYKLKYSTKDVKNHYWKELKLYSLSGIKTAIKRLCSDKGRLPMIPKPYEIKPLLNTSIARIDEQKEPVYEKNIWKPTCYLVFCELISTQIIGEDKNGRKIVYCKKHADDWFFAEQIAKYGARNNAVLNKILAEKNPLMMKWIRWWEKHNSR